MDARANYEQHLANMQAIEEFKKTLPPTNTLNHGTRVAEQLYAAAGRNSVGVDAALGTYQKYPEEGLFWDLHVDDYQDTWNASIFTAWEQLDSEDPVRDFREAKHLAETTKQKKRDLEELARLQDKYPEGL